MGPEPTGGLRSRRPTIASAVLLLVASCAHPGVSGTRGPSHAATMAPSSASPSGHAQKKTRHQDPISLPPLPGQGVVLGRRDRLDFVSLDGRVVARLDGASLYFEWTVPGRVIVRRHGWYFLLRVGAHDLKPLPSERTASDLVPQDQRGLRLALPPGEKRSGGHWEYALPSPDGSRLLAQWSGECEVPAAFFASADGSEVDPVVGGPDLANVPESRGLGWTADGRAVVHLMSGLCGPGRPPGVYLFDQPGRGTVLVRLPSDGSARMWGPA